MSRGVGAVPGKRRRARQKWFGRDAAAVRRTEQIGRKSRVARYSIPGRAVHKSIAFTRVPYTAE